MTPNESMDKKHWEDFLDRCRADVESGLYDSLAEAIDGHSQDGDHELRQKLGEAELERLVRPKELGFIYFLLNCGEVVYVGKSDGLVGNRIRAARRQGWEFTAERILPCPFTGYELEVEEQRYIKIFDPLYNKRKWT